MLPTPEPHEGDCETGGRIYRPTVMSAAPGDRSGALLREVRVPAPHSESYKFGPWSRDLGMVAPDLVPCSALAR